MHEPKDDTANVGAKKGDRALSPAAKRALAEAEERRRVATSTPHAGVPEVKGRNGPDPVRYGDWEVKGIASDF
ncbi:MAG TPA: DUF1674 domain-containing protein [Methylocella sp.]|nr:DUF1674 domain-containing protein [Methylocella sp.]